MRNILGILMKIFLTKVSGRQIVKPGRNAILVLPQKELRTKTNFRSSRITGVLPVFIDRHLVVGLRWQYVSMERNATKSKIYGKRSYIYPENLCEVIEDTGERIPVEEFKHKM